MVDEAKQPKNVEELSVSIPRLGITFQKDTKNRINNLQIG